MTLASTVLKKSTFQNSSYLIALGGKFDLVNRRSLFEQTW